MQVPLQRLSQPRKSSDIASSPTEIVTAKKELRYCKFPYRDCHSQERAQILQVPLRKEGEQKNVSTTRSVVSGKKPGAVEVQEDRDIRKISSGKKPGAVEVQEDRDIRKISSGKKPGAVEVQEDRDIRKISSGKKPEAVEVQEDRDIRKISSGKKPEAVEVQEERDIRKISSGKKPEAVAVQEDRDIRKISSEKARKIVMISNRWRNRTIIPKAYALAIKSRLGVSRDKFWELTRMLRKQGVNVENETAQRKLQQDILPQDLVVETHNFSFKNDQKEEYFRQTQAIFIDNIENYLFNLLNQYQSQSELSWHGGSIPEEEIWVKIGGDHGQGSLKVTLQTLNVEKPNSKFFTSIIAMANVPDNVKNFHRPNQCSESGHMEWQENLCLPVWGLPFSNRCPWHIWIVWDTSLPLVPPDEYRDR